MNAFAQRLKALTAYLADQQLVLIMPTVKPDPAWIAAEEVRYKTKSAIALARTGSKRIAAASEVDAVIEKARGRI